MSENCWTYEKDDCLGNSACKYCADAIVVQCWDAKTDYGILKLDGTVPTCVAGKSSPVGAIVGVLIPILLIVGVWAYWVFVLNVKAVANGHESFIAELKAEQAEDVKTGVELTFGKKFRNCVISTYDVCAASVLCALCCKVEDAAAPVADAKDTDTATTAPAGEAVAAPQV